MESGYFKGSDMLIAGKDNEVSKSGVSAPAGTNTSTIQIAPPPPSLPTTTTILPNLAQKRPEEIDFRFILAQMDDHAGGWPDGGLVRSNREAIWKIRRRRRTMNIVPWWHDFTHQIIRRSSGDGFSSPAPNGAWKHFWDANCATNCVTLVIIVMISICHVALRSSQKRHDDTLELLLM